MDVQKSGASKWMVLMLLVAAFTVTFMTRFVWSPLNATVSGELGMSNIEAGAFMSAFFVGYVITQIPGGALADRFGVKFVISIGVFVTGLASIGMSLITGYTEGMILRVLTGIGAGVVMSCCAKAISVNFEQKDRGIAFGILLVGPTVGLMLANQIGSALLTTFSWQAAFQAVGIIAMVVAVVLAIFIKNTKSSGTAEKVTLFTGIKAVFTSRNLICICLAGFLYMFLNLGVSTWANSYLGSIGYDAVTSSNVMTLYSVGGIIGSLLTGIIVRKFNLSVKIYLIVIFILIAITTVVFGFQTHLTILMVSGFAYGFVSYLPNAHLNALTTKFAPRNLEGSVIGVQNCIFQLASILSPVVVGWTVDVTGAFQTCWFTLAAMPVLGLIFLFLLKDPKQVKKPEELEATQS